MPSSARENDQFMRDFVADNAIRNVLDVGVGEGTYSNLLRPYVEHIDGIEVWVPYVEQFDLYSKYDILTIMDAREYFATTSRFPDTAPYYDLIIFGDILEHMSEQSAVQMWNHAGKQSRFCMASVPIIHYPQGPEFGNPYEEHVQEDLTPNKMDELFGPFEASAVYGITGTFIRRFNV